MPLVWFGSVVYLYKDEVLFVWMYNVAFTVGDKAQQNSYPSARHSWHFYPNEKELF